MVVANGSKSGLGRGLAALIPEAEDLEGRYLDDTERLLRSLANAGFDLLEEGSSLALCAYLHVPRGDDPHLFLRSPEFSTLTPSRAFRLCHAISVLTNHEEAAGCFTWEGLDGWYIRTSGPDSDGMHVVGRSNGRMDYGTHQITREICLAFGDLAHQVQHGGADTTVAPALSVEIENGTTTVEASVELPDGTLSSGFGTATDRREAVARAVIAATGCNHRFIDVRNLALEDKRGSLVVLLDRSGALRLGITMVTEDVITAAAIATTRAIKPHSD